MGREREDWTAFVGVLGKKGAEATKEERSEKRGQRKGSAFPSCFSLQFSLFLLSFPLYCLSSLS